MAEELQEDELNDVTEKFVDNDSDYLQRTCAAVLLNRVDFRVVRLSRDSKTLFKDDWQFGD